MYNEPPQSENHDLSLEKKNHNLQPFEFFAIFVVR